MEPIIATVFGTRNGTWIIPDGRDQSEFERDCENEGTAVIIGMTAYHAIYLPGPYQSRGRTIYYRGQINSDGELRGNWNEIDPDEMPTQIREAINA